MATEISESMTRDVMFMNPADSLVDAYDIMECNGFRHVPVVEKGRLVGILSDRDVLLHAKTRKNGMIDVPEVPIGSVMSRHPVTCREDSRVADVATVMIARKIDCLPVIDGKGLLVGMITSSDLLELLREDEDGLAAKVIPFGFRLKEYEAIAGYGSAYDGG